jgi:fibronectin-binding autotransporter adhesin
MSAISWIAAGNGNWTTASNWSGGIVPGANDDVTIGLSGAFTVSITSPVSAHSLTLNNSGATVLDTGSLTLTGVLTLTAGTFNLGAGGSIVGGSIVDNTSNLFCAGGTLDGVTYQGQLNLISGGQAVTIVNGITLSGVNGVGRANINTSGATIALQGTQTLDNALLSLGASTINSTDPGGTGSVLTIGANTIIGSSNLGTSTVNDAGGAKDGIVNLGQFQVGAGTVNVNGNSFVNDGSVVIQNAPSAKLNFNSATFLNNGTIGASGGGILKFLDANFTNAGQISISSATQLIIGTAGSSWTNAGGTITMSGGTLELDSNFVTANLGTINGSGGTLKILGTLDNTGATLTTGTGTAFTGLIVAGTIKKGTVIGPSSAGLAFQGGMVDGVTYQGNIDLSASGATGTIVHSIVLSGAGGVGKSTIALTGTASKLNVDGNVTLDNVTINLASTLASTDQAGTGAMLTLGANASIIETGALATISSAFNAGDGIVLNGNLTVNSGQNQVLNILTPSLTSNGTITIGSFDTINLVNGAPGGTVVNLNGGSFTLGNGSTIIGGTIVDGGSRFLMPNAATLNGVTYQGVLDLTGPSCDPTIINGITLSGVGSVGKATIDFTGTGTIDFVGNGTLDNATVNFGTNQNGISDLFANDPQSKGSILTLGSNLLIQQVGKRALIGSSGLATDGVINNGEIEAGVSGGSMAIDPQNFTNAGIVNVTNGESLDFGGANFTNAPAGTVTATTGATVSIDGTGSWSNAGSISENNGTLNLGGNFTTAAIGNVTRTGGTINITGKLDNTGATLAFGAGTLLGAVNVSGTIKNGTIQSTANGVTGSANFGGGTFDGVNFQGTLDMTTTQGQLTIINGITLTGTGGSGAATINLTGTSAGLTLKGIETLDNATINLGTNGNGPSVLLAYDPFNTGTIITLGPNLTIQQTGLHAQLQESALGTDGFINKGTINAGISSGSLTLIPQSNSAGGVFTNAGTINASNTDTVEVGATTFTNTVAGTVNVTTGATFTIDGTGIWSNAGLLNETSGTLILGGNFTTAGLGTVTRSGGTVKISGILDNTGSSVAFGNGSALGAVQLTGTIKNGTIQGGPNGLAPSGGATLDGVSYQGILDLSAAQSALLAIGGIAFSGVGGTGQATVNITGAGSSLSGKGNETFDNATINLGTSGNGQALLYAADPYAKGTIITLGPNLTIQQAGTRAELEAQDIGTNGFINQGTINAGFAGGTMTIFQRQFNVGGEFTNAGAINISNTDSVEIGVTTFSNTATGTISVTGGSTLAIDGTGSWASAGTISEAGSTLTLGGNFNTASLNTVTRSGGTVNLSGVIDNTSATINIGTGSALGTVNFSGTINGGIVHDGGNGLVANSGTLSGVTYQGTVNLSALSAQLTVTNGIALTDLTGNNPGTVNLTGFSSTLSVKGNAFLDNATINIGNNGNTSTLFNYGGAVGGNTLTFGPNLTIHQTGTYAAISGTGTAGDNVVNQGTIDASLASGSFIINPLAFTNSGVLIAGASGEVVDLRSTNLTNLSGNTLTNGVFQASAGGTIQLTNNATVTTIQSDVTESGSASAIRSLIAGNVQRNIDTTLTTIGASGALRLLAGHNLSTGNAFTIAGILQLGGTAFSTGAVTESATGKIVGNGTVSAAITDNGLIEAAGGKLTLSGPVSGSGSLQIDAGATLELASASADQQGVSFAGSNGTLMIDTPSAYTGTITGFGATEAIDLKNTIATGATLNGTTMTVMLSGGGTQTYTLSAPLPGVLLNATSDGNGGTLIIDSQNNIAVGKVATFAGGNNTPTMIDFGNQRAGKTLSEMLRVTNTAVAPAEGLDADIGGTTGAVTATGSINLLGAGATDQSSLKVSLDATTAGVKTGSVTVGLSSDGSASGGGITALPNQTVNVQATIYRLANGVVATLPSMVVHVGDTVNEALSITNNVANDGFSEKLDVSVFGADAGLSGSGTIQLLGAGATDQSSLSVGVSTASAGTVSGQVQLLLKSDGNGTSGFTATSTGLANVDVNVQVDNYATATFSKLAGGTLTQTGAHSYTLDLGTARAGSGPLSAMFGVKNSAAGLADLLSGNFGDSGGAGFTVSGTSAFSGLGAGQSDQNLQATLSTTKAGTFTDTITLHGTGSNGSGYSGALADTTLIITGKVQNAAVATINTTVPIDFGNHHVGDVVTQAVSLTNSAPNGLSEALDGSFAALPAGITGSGSVSLLAAGATDATHLKLGIATTVSGAENGTATLKLSSDNGTSQTALPSQTINVSGAVYAYASPIVAATLNFGATRVGTALNKSIALADGNFANPFQESLKYAAGAAPSGYALTGMASGTVASGNSASIGVSLAGSVAGDFTGETLSLGLTSTGAGTSGLADTVLTPQQITVSGKVYAAAAAKLSATSIDFGNIHVGAGATKTLQVTNTATGALVDTLTGGFATVSNAFGATGNGMLTAGGLAAGASGNLGIMFSAGAEGSFAGTATLNLASHDSALNDLHVSTGSVALSGKAYALAKPVLSGKTTIDFGSIRVGASVGQSQLLVSDGSATDPFQESLTYTLGALPTGFMVSGATAGTVAAGSKQSLLFSLNAFTAGDFTGKNVSLALSSTGTGTSGLADTVLTARTISLSGKVYATATAVLSATTVDFGTVHVGDTVSRTVGIKNGATGGLTDVLTGGIGAVTGQFTATGTLGTGLAAGVSHNVNFGIDTTKAGAFTGSATLALNSHDADLADIAVSAGSIALKGNIDNYAAAAFKKSSGVGTFTKQGANYLLNLGTVAQGSTAATTMLAAFNSATGLADKLAGSFTAKGSTSIFTATGFTQFSGLGAGQATGAMKISLSTTQYGTFTETITLTGTGSNSSGYSGTLASETLTITGTVLAPKHTYTLSVFPDSITGGNNDDTFIGTTSTLSASDSIDGGAGQNMLILNGGGGFDLRAPTKLVNIQTLTAHEGQKSTVVAQNHQQTVNLRDGLDVTVNVAANPNPIATSRTPESIVIYGAANNDIINLGGGADTVYLGGTGETVNGGAGTDLIVSTAAMAGALIKGGTGKTTLEITNGGAATLNAADTKLTVQLDAATNLNIQNGQGVTVTGPTSVADTIRGKTAALDHLTIGNFAGGKDTLDFSDLSFNQSTVVKFTANAAHTGGTLSIGNSSLTASVTLFGQYVAANFGAAADGAGGTEITYVPMGATTPQLAPHA